MAEDRSSELLHVLDPATARDVPIRQRSLNGQPPACHRFVRTCGRCGACFLHLAPGKTGERGLWSSHGSMKWYCSQECYDLSGEPPVDENRVVVVSGDPR